MAEANAQGDNVEGKAAETKAEKPAAAKPVAEKPSQQQTGGDSLDEANQEELRAQVKQLRKEAQSYRERMKANETELEKISREREEARVKEATEQGKFKDLYEAEKRSRAAAEGAATRKIKAAEVRSVAVEQGIVSRAVAKLIPLEGVEVDDDGNVTGALEAVQKFKESEPALFGKFVVQAQEEQKRPTERIITIGDKQYTIAEPPAEAAQTFVPAKTPAIQQKPQKLDARDLTKQQYTQLKNEMLRNLRTQRR